MTKKILVTGGAGYIGSVLVPKLLDSGYEIRVFDKLIFGDFGLAAVRNKIELIKGDIQNPPPDLMDGIYAVIHLAGFSTEPTSYYNPRYTDLINHLSTETIARLAKSRGVKRFLFASSCSVYFTYDTPLIPPLYKEEDRVNSISPYSLSKRAAEEALLELTNQDFQPTIFRKGTIYGFSPKMRYDLVLNSFTKDAFHKRHIIVHAGGEIYRPMLDLRDTVAAYIAALELPLETIGGKIFNLLNSNWRIGDLSDYFKDMIKTHKNISVNIDIHPVGIARNYRADDSNFKKVFNLKPLRSIDDAVFEIWQELENGHNFNDLRYYNDLWQQEMIKQGKTEFI